MRFRGKACSQREEELEIALTGPNSTRFSSIIFLKISVPGKQWPIPTHSGEWQDWQWRKLASWVLQCLHFSLCKPWPSPILWTFRRKQWGRDRSVVSNLFYSLTYWSPEAARRGGWTYRCQWWGLYSVGCLSEQYKYLEREDQEEVDLCEKQSQGRGWWWAGWKIRIP